MTTEEFLTLSYWKSLQHELLVELYQSGGDPLPDSWWQQLNSLLAFQRQEGYELSLLVPMDKKL
jgi:hypothetical protein